jgi:glycerol kinase
MNELVGALDQGTTSTRFIVFDAEGKAVASAQQEHRQIFPRPGWVEHDPVEIWERSKAVVGSALATAGINAMDLAGVGITNQRETVVVWERSTGAPVANAIVWQDTRTAAICMGLAGDEGPDRLRAKTGLPLATYFSGPKLRWLLDSDPTLRRRSESGELAAGTIDSWLAWNLTGGMHVTDPTNASRTMLMDLETREWDEGLCSLMGVPSALLPEIAPSAGINAPITEGPLAGARLGAILGDQQAALFGQGCFEPGMAKNTYGTGCFLLTNTGGTPVPSSRGLLTTVGYQVEGDPATYALEGSVAVAGALVQWLRDNLGLIGDAAEIESLAASVADTGDVYLVPAFSGLFAPHWRPDARGVLVGLTRYTTKAHIALAALQATAFQTAELVEAMEGDSGTAVSELRVDGGMTANRLLMQLQADLLGVPVLLPPVAETTALGAASAAGLAAGLFSSTAELAGRWRETARYSPSMEGGRRQEMMARWRQAVERSLGWADPGS